jgi:hypothetical protein
MFQETTLDPKAALIAGVKLLDPILSREGFVFVVETERQSSGGRSCSGAFVRGNRRLELHFCWSLGFISYQVGEMMLSHSEYLRAQGVKGKYPGFSDKPIESFEHLRSDLDQAGRVFLSGNKEEFKQLVEKSKKFPEPKGFKALEK